MVRGFYPLYCPRARAKVEVVAPISIEKTKILVDRSLRDYLTCRQATLKAHLNGKSISKSLEKSEESSNPTAATLTVPHTTPIDLSSLATHTDGYTPEWKLSDPGTKIDLSHRSSYELQFPSANRQRANSETAVPQLPHRPPPVPPKDDVGRSNDPSPRRMPLETSRRNAENIPASLEHDPKLDQHPEISKRVFPSLDDYIVASFASYDCLNSSFSTVKEAPSVLPGSQPHGPIESQLNDNTPKSGQVIFPGLDEKTILLGDSVENGAWRTGSGEKQIAARVHKEIRAESPEKSDLLSDLVSIKTPRIDWVEVRQFYQTILHMGKGWKSIWHEIMSTDLNGPDGDLSAFYGAEETAIEQEIHEACLRTRRILLKATETLLKRPGRPLKHPFEIRFLLILLNNPLLHQDSALQANGDQLIRKSGQQTSKLTVPGRSRVGSHRAQSGPGQHSGIIKRILGIMSNLPNECHRHIVSWLSRLSEDHFKQTVELIGSFVTYRLTQQHGRKRSNEVLDPTASLIPSFETPGAESSAGLHAALEVGVPSKVSAKEDNDPTVYSEDWRIKAAAKVMALFFSANSNATVQKTDRERQQVAERTPLSADRAAQLRAHSHGQMLPTSDFYNTLLDYSDLVADFEAWEKRKAQFSFCQYPFFLSIWAKIHILEYDARRQMEVRAREAFFTSIMTRQTIPQYLVLRVRRDCLVEDSLQSVSEVIGAGEAEIKKGLRIDFIGEEGIDAGGLRKEWFLLLVRDIFDPNHGEYLKMLSPLHRRLTRSGLFIYDEDSHYCYFNPHCLETSDQFFLVGVLLGLAIYNSTILDIALPPFAFRKMLASAPVPGSSIPHSSTARSNLTFTVDDLAEYRPALARGLKQLLEFEGNVEETFCRDFVVEVDRFGCKTQVPLCPGGRNRPVTNSNRREFVDLYVTYLLSTAVARQFEPFKRGFFTVCGGNALSLFRPEEIELLVRGSDEPLDISSLRAVAVYENWGRKSPADTEPVIKWFWEFFERISPKKQRKVLGFITGSDRIPAMGATNMIIKLVCLGDDCERFPVARTCFNCLQLWRYRSRQTLETRLWRAIVDSEGFGLK